MLLLGNKKWVKEYMYLFFFYKPLVYSRNLAQDQREVDNVPNYSNLFGLTFLFHQTSLKIFDLHYIPMAYIF